MLRESKPQQHIAHQPSRGPGFPHTGFTNVPTRPEPVPQLVVEKCGKCPYACYCIPFNCCYCPCCPFRTTLNLCGKQKNDCLGATQFCLPCGKDALRGFCPPAAACAPIRVTPPRRPHVRRVRFGLLRNGSWIGRMLLSVDRQRYQ